MNRPRFRLRTLMLAVAGAGLLFGLCRRAIDLFGWSALAPVLAILVVVPSLFLILILISLATVLLAALISYVIEQVLRRLNSS